MALDPLYFRTITCLEYFNDPLTGLPLSGGTMEFYRDVNRGQPKLVYQLAGSPPNYTYEELPNPVELNDTGHPINESGVPLGIYYYPYDADGNLDLYYIVVRRSITEGGAIVYEFPAMPNITAADDPNKTENSISNELSNSQFVDILFNEEFGSIISFSTALSNEVYNIAPGWDLVVSSSGSGTITLSRTALAGSLDIITNPPYRLNITTGGGTITSAYLRQRLYHNPNIWSNGYLSGSLVAISLDGTSHDIEMTYAPSVAPAETIIVSGSTGSIDYVRLNSTVLLSPGLNTDTADDGYVDIKITLPDQGSVGITSVQVVGLDTNEDEVSYDQQPVNRQQDYLYHYYQPSLMQKPGGNYLIGWHFPLNPTQFTSDANGTFAALSVGANKSYYVWDQTILYSSTSGGVSVSKVQNVLQLNMAITTKPAIIQYLTAKDAHEILMNRLSVYMEMFQGGLADGVVGTVTLWYTKQSTLPDIKSPNYLSLVNTLDANGRPDSFNGTWFEVPRVGLGDARFRISQSTLDTLDKFSFSGWYLDDITEATSATFFAIVVGFQEISATSNVRIKEISLCPGDVPYKSDFLNNIDVLRQCQRFYERSFLLGVPNGTATSANIFEAHFFGGVLTSSLSPTYNGHAQSFVIPCQTKDILPQFFNSYSPNSATVDRMSVGIMVGGGFPTPNSGSNPATITFSSSFDASFHYDRVIIHPTGTASIFSMGFLSDLNDAKEQVFQLNYTINALLGN